MSRLRLQNAVWPLLAVFVGMGCSLRYDFDECDDDRDCRRFEEPSAGRFYECRANVCGAVDIECREDGDCADGRTCRDNRCRGGMESDAGETGSDGGEVSVDAGDTGADKACETTQECVERFGSGWYCAPSGVCRDASHPNCDPISYPSEGSKDGDVVLLGSIIPTETEGFKEVGETIENGVDMAVLEYFNNAPRTLPGGQVVAHLHCQGGDSETAIASARHLKSLEVPVILGPLTSGNYIDVVTEVTAADNDGTAQAPVATISMSGTSPSIGSLDASGVYSFQTVANDQFQTSAVVDRAKNLRRRRCTASDGQGGTVNCASDADCRQTFGPDYVYDDSNPERVCRDTDPRVAVFFKDDQYGRDFQSLLTNRFTRLYPEATVEYYRYKNPAELGFEKNRVAQEFASVVSEALDPNGGLPEADIAMFVGSGEAAGLAEAYIRAVGNADGLDPLARRYLFSHGAASDVPGMFEELDDSFLPTMEAVAPNVFNQPYYEFWVKRYLVFAGSSSETSAGGLAYDAAYLSIFAMGATSQDGPITGASVADVLAEGRLQAEAGQTIVFEDNTTFPGKAREALSEGKSLDLVGVSGDLDFVFDDDDANTGTVRSNYVGFDVRKRDDVSGTVYELDPSRAYVLEPGRNVGAWTRLMGD